MRHVPVAAAVLLSLLIVAPGPASASPIVLDFEGLGDLNHVGSYYNGGAGGNLGVEFWSSAMSLVQAGQGGTGNFSNAPSGKSIAFFELGQSSMNMNVAGGFINSFSFAYTSLFFPGVVSIWDGVGGTGHLLAIAPLPRLNGGCGGGAPGAFNCWSPVALNFAGTAQSVTWSGVGNFLGVDDVRLDTASRAVPEPSSVLLLGTGLGWVALRRRMRRS